MKLPAVFLGIVLSLPFTLAAQVARFSTGYVNGSAIGQTSDFTSMATGWGYFWNAPDGWVPGGSSGDGTSHPIGDPANYVPLIWPGATNWTADGDLTNSNNQPSGFLRVAGGSAHPGLGSTQTGSFGNTQDRYVIYGYEIQPLDGAGYYSITDSTIAGVTASGTPLRVFIHVNADAPLLNAAYAKDGIVRGFDTPLGELAIGDRIYVCVGPDGSAASDSVVNFDFAISKGTPPMPLPHPPAPPLGGAPVPIEIVNPSAEINGGVSPQNVGDPAVTGWSASGGTAQVIRWETLAGKGDWRFAIEDSVTLFQPTGHVITAGEAFSLRFEASSFTGAPEEIIAELWVDDGAGGQEVVAGRTFSFLSLTRADWQTFQLVSYWGEFDAHAGKKLGVRFRGNGALTSAFIGIDDVRLTAYDGVEAAQTFSADWSGLPDRVWAGERFWSNRLQDWEVRGGRLECVVAATGEPYRTTHLLTHRLDQIPATFSLSVRTGAIEGSAGNAFSGFLIGAGQGLDYRGASMVHHNGGKDGGLFAGVDGLGRATFRDNRSAVVPTLNVSGIPASLPAELIVELVGVYIGPDYQLELTVKDASDGTVVSEAFISDVSPERVIGNVALVSHPGTGGSPSRFWFRDWQGSGSKLDAGQGGSFGPVLCAQHTLSRGVLKLTAQMAPFSPSDAATAVLEADTGGGFLPVATEAIDPIAHTATFRIASWNDTADTPYRVKVSLQGTDHFFTGTVRRDPADKAEITLAGMNCMTHVIKSGNGAQGVDTTNTVLWSPDFVIFPHADLTGGMAAADPDVLFFSGDQIYEGSSPTGADNSSAANRELDYLYKWFFWCWTFQDLLRDVPSVCIPDDHDVYQGNLWGQGGRAIGAQEEGGYTRPAQFVKMVERTQTSHLPDPFDPTPVAQGIGVYYGSLLYGRVDFAILEDRKFKNGFQNQPGMPASIPGGGTPMADPSIVDPPGLELLGARQELFLDAWVSDWQGADLKAALSQTMFSSTTTHTGEGLARRYHDYDSGGWPHSGRNRAIERIRKAFAPHICGDQHLSVIVRHGIDSFGDSNFAFCMPAGANFFPRAFDPDNLGAGPTAVVSPVLRDYTDGFGNLLTTYAVANPASYYATSLNRAPLDLHDRAPGYAIIRFDKPARTVTFENWPRYADPSDPSQQYDGWPMTVRQFDNYGRAPVGYLPVIDTPGVVEVIDEATDETLYALRVDAVPFRPHVFDLAGTYRMLLDGVAVSGLSAAAAGENAIARFVAVPGTVIRGSETTLSWDVTPGAALSLGAVDADAATINGIGSARVPVNAETVFTLQSTLGGATVGQSVTVRVFPTIEEWRDLYFEPEELATIGLDGEDPDEDGIANLLEYALGGDPRTYSPLLLPTVAVFADGTFAVQARELLNVPGVRYEIQFSASLADWEPAENSAFEPSGSAGDWSTVGAAGAIPGGMRFVRVALIAE